MPADAAVVFLTSGRYWPTDAGREGCTHCDDREQYADQGLPELLITAAGARTRQHS